MTKSEFYFNGIQVERVDKYKYLGVIINSTKGSKIDILASNADCVIRHDEPYLAYTENKVDQLSAIKYRLSSLSQSGTTYHVVWRWRLGEVYLS